MKLEPENCYIDTKNSDRPWREKNKGNLIWNKKIKNEPLALNKCLEKEIEKGRDVHFLDCTPGV